MTYLDDDDPRVRSLGAMLRDLPSEEPPPPGVLPRIRAGLRRRGGARSIPGAPAPARGWRLLSAGLAAGIVLGFLIGRREAKATPTAPGAGGSWAAAVDVQRTGTAYVTALGRLGRFKDAAGPGVVQGREVAVTLLFGAALAYAEQAPDDPTTLNLLHAVQQARNAAAPNAAAERPVRF